MNRNVKKSAAVAALVMVTWFPCLSQTQESKGTHRKVRVADGNTSAIAEAEALMEKRDFSAAESKLLAIAQANPNDYRAWFDLGYVYSATDRNDKAIEAYRKSIAAQPGVLEPNLNLGILLLAKGDPEAGRYLRAAEKLKPSPDVQKRITRAWVALGDVLAAKDRVGAIDAYEQAAQLDAADPYPHVALARMYEQSKDDKNAEKQYKAALALDANSADAISGLTGIYLREKRTSEAEPMLRDLVQKQPASAGVHLQMARLLASEGKHEEAITEYEKALQLAPTNLDAHRGLAESEMELKQWDKAAATLRPLLQRSPNDGDLHYLMGDVLMRAKQFEPAQNEFMTAAKLKPNWAEPYAGVAFSANEQKNYELAIRALDARAKLAPETPQTYFLRATCLDNLGAKKDASVYYKKFLEVANGKMPDQEWQARHRLIAIDPETRKKAK